MGHTNPPESMPPALHSAARHLGRRDPQPHPQSHEDRRWRSRRRRRSPALSAGPGPQWARRQGLVQGLLLYPDGGGGGLRPPLLPAKHVLAELGGVHASPAGRSHAETPLEQPLQDLPGTNRVSNAQLQICRQLPSPVNTSRLTTEVQNHNRQDRGGQAPGTLSEQSECATACRVPSRGQGGRKSLRGHCLFSGATSLSPDTWSRAPPH